VKKGFVILLLALAVIVLVSPGLVGHLAEKSMDENLDWAATESPELTITSQGFDRGWFSSEGQHRVELRQGDIRDTLLALVASSDFDGLPALIIDTRIDHGLVPLTSMAREKGTLLPGLGSAVSTLRLEFENGETIDVPGTIYSDVGLTGELRSNLILEPGTFSDGDETAQWGDVDVLITTNPSTKIVGFKGALDEVAFVSPYNEVTIGPLHFGGNQQRTRFGPYVGDAEFTIEKITMPASWGQDSMGPISFTSTAALDDDAMTGRTTILLDDLPFGDLGRARINMDISADDIDAEALGNLARTYNGLDGYASDDEIWALMEDDFKQLFASGFELHVVQLDVAFQPGTVSAELNVRMDDTDLDTFVWTSALLAVDATMDLSVPAELMEYVISLDPQAGAAVGMGFLRRNQDVYEMEAAFKDGLLTINDAPMPVPWLGGN
jgi:uncharacterized protein YdgA (DUF945 family)